MPKSSKRMDQKLRRRHVEDINEALSTDPLTRMSDGLCFNRGFEKTGKRNTFLHPDTTAEKGGVIAVVYTTYNVRPPVFVKKDGQNVLAIGVTAKSVVDCINFLGDHFCAISVGGKTLDPEQYANRS